MRLLRLISDPPGPELVVHFSETGEGKPHTPFRGHAGDAGCDLYVSRPGVIRAHSFADLHADINIQMPAGIWGRITGRSSTPRKYGLQVQEGIVDNGYRGEIFIGVWNNTPNTFEITEKMVEEGIRLAQIVFYPLVPVRWVMVEQGLLHETDRGEAGFGSTGR